MILLDFQCRTTGTTFERLCDRPAPERVTCTCGSPAERVISIPHLKVPLASAVRQGAPEKAPPGALDTRSLAEGQPYSEWKRDRARQRGKERLESAWRESRT